MQFGAFNSDFLRRLYYCLWFLQVYVCLKTRRVSLHERQDWIVTCHEMCYSIYIRVKMHKTCSIPPPLLKKNFFLGILNSVGLKIYILYVFYLFIFCKRMDVQRNFSIQQMHQFYKQKQPNCHSHTILHRIIRGAYFRRSISGYSPSHEAKTVFYLIFGTL